MMGINRLPDKLLLKIFPRLPLASIIAAQCVCTRWRTLMPFADVGLDRRALLELYLEIISSPFFEQTRPWVLANLRPFNRQAYVNTLLQQHGYLPEAFRLWILEWPERAVIGCIWPGLPVRGGQVLSADGADWLECNNWLGCIPPQVSVMMWQHSDSNRTVFEHIPAILLGSTHRGFDWLVLDERERFWDKVYEDVSMTIMDEPENRYLPHWVAWLRMTWKRIDTAFGRDGTPVVPANVRRDISGSPVNWQSTTWSRTDAMIGRGRAPLARADFYRGTSKIPAIAWTKKA